MMKLSTGRRLQLKQLFAYIGNGGEAGYCVFVGLPRANGTRMLQVVVPIEA
jgi:hypothetical protein